MNVYDTANKLAFEMKNSNEYKEYKEAKDRVMQNTELKAKIEEFEKIRYEAQVLAIQKGESDTEKIQKLQELYSILIDNKEIKEYFDL